MKIKNVEISDKRATIMGVLNVTPDSFSDGGLYVDLDKAVAHAKQMVEEGADIIDVGGESSRPGSDPVSEEEELRRVLPVVERLVSELSVPISIDSYKPSVVDACLSVGASIANDISGLRNPEMIKVVAKHNVPVVVMHMQGEPKTMQKDPHYGDVVGEVKKFFEERINVARAGGVKDIILDPGIGFGKKLEHNLLLMKHINAFCDLGCPVLSGPSRKSFIGMITGLPARERLEGTMGAVAASVMGGAQIVRVHDVKECRRMLDVVDAIKESG